MTRKSGINALPPRRAGEGSSGPLPPNKKRMSYEHWAIERLRNKDMCRMERSMTCVPLRDDPICLACFEGEEEARRKDADT
jgi:hypothetical protein